MADVLIANKLDTYDVKDTRIFKDYVFQFTQTTGKPKAHIAMVVQGELQLEWLDIPHDKSRTVSFSKSHQSHSHTGELPNKNASWQLIEGHTDGYFSLSWQLDRKFMFNTEKFICWLKEIREELNIDRIKCAMFSDSGWISINMTEHESAVSSIESFTFNIIEIISSNKLNADQLDNQLRQYCEHG